MKLVDTLTIGDGINQLVQRSINIEAADQMQSDVARLANTLNLMLLTDFTKWAAAQRVDFADGAAEVRERWSQE